jgi:hypothetical protein
MSTAPTTHSAQSSITTKAAFSAPTTPSIKTISDPMAAPQISPVEDPNVGTAVTTPNLKHKDRRVSKVTRFTELETIDSHVEKSQFQLNFPYEAQRPQRPSVMPPPVSHEDVNRAFVQPMVVQPIERPVMQAAPVMQQPPQPKPEPIPAQTGKKLLKNKLLKKRLSKAQPVAV